MDCTNAQQKYLQKRGWTMSRQLCDTISIGLNTQRYRQCTDITAKNGTGKWTITVRKDIK
jgi:hypothetical protein